MIKALKRLDFSEKPLLMQSKFDTFKNLKRREEELEKEEKLVVSGKRIFAMLTTDSVTEELFISLYGKSNYGDCGICVNVRLSELLGIEMSENGYCIGFKE